MQKKILPGGTKVLHNDIFELQAIRISAHDPIEGFSDCTREHEVMQKNGADLTQRPFPRRGMTGMPSQLSDCRIILCRYAVKREDTCSQAEPAPSWSGRVSVKKKRHLERCLSVEIDSA